MKKKQLRWTLWTIASPFILFIILCILIYLPPIQNFLVDKAAVYASEATGMNISVGRISLSFPLNLVVTDVDAASPHKDTLLRDVYKRQHHRCPAWRYPMRFCCPDRRPGS